MPYTSRESDANLTGEEMDVRSALAGYSTAGAGRFDFAPMSKLWQTYLTWWASNRWRNQWDTESAPQLTLRQFGRAVRRVFAGVHRCKRTYGGIQQWGYAGLCGPHSTVTPPPRKKEPAHCEPVQGGYSVVDPVTG